MNCERCRVGFTREPSPVPGSIAPGSREERALNCQECQECAVSKLGARVNSTVLCVRDARHAAEYRAELGARGWAARELDAEVKPGACVCDPKFGGPACDRCAPGHFGYPTCNKCACDPAGTLPDKLDYCNASNGRCNCKVLCLQDMFKTSEMRIYSGVLF